MKKRNQKQEINNSEIVGLNKKTRSKLTEYACEEYRLSHEKLASMHDLLVVMAWCLILHEI